MKNFIDVLKQKEKELELILSKSQEDIKNAPEGILRICGNKDQKQYYWKKNIDQKSQYIRRKDVKIAYALAQKSYAERVVKCAENNLKAIRKFLSEYKVDGIENVYERFHEDRKQLIYPYILPKEEFIRKWENEQYESKSFGQDENQIYTEKGERVRSKSEKIIADKLYIMNIPYHYEKPLFLKGFGTIYPDFTILNIRTKEIFYYEHFGMMDNMEYCEKALSKISNYEKNNILIGKQLLISFETKNRPLNIQLVNQKINQYLL